MPRLRNKAGVVVNVDDATAARLGSDWQPADEGDEKKAAPKRSTTTKK